MRRLQQKKIFSGAGIALATSDRGLWVRAAACPVNVIRRSEESASAAAPLSKIFEFIEGIDATHFLWVNACHPFLKDETILEAAELFMANDHIRSMTSVEATKTLMWDGDYVPLVKQRECRTDTGDVTFVATHAFHIWSKREVLDNDRPWGQTGSFDPFLYEIRDPIENLDGDTQKEFEILSAIARAKEVQK